MENRQIKFRVWDKETKTMHDVMKLDWYTNSGCTDSRPSQISTMWEDKTNGKIATKFEIMQAIGVGDKFGIEIFEGDLIKYQKHKGYTLPDFTAEVVWMKDCACFGYKVKDTYTIPFSSHDELEHDFLSHTEIIGNIYQTPDKIS